MKDILETLKSRELLDNVTGALPNHPVRVYAGFDPSADCLHLGNFVGIAVLRWFQKLGHTPVVILGGATGMIGDPSGKSKERNLLDAATLEHNVRSIEKLMRHLLRSEAGLPEPIFLNNYDWFKQFSFIDFLRDVGKHFRVGTMMAKESVKQRLHSEEGISFTEFCYQTLQGYDFYHLFEHHNVAVQCGGSDQWGNITAGCDLISRKSQKNEKGIGLAWPLLLRSDGRKFGKSEEGAVWLGREKLSAYKFYQYAFQTPDADVIKFMKRLTMMPLEEIEHYEKELLAGRLEPNAAQKRYAEELTRIVHGEEGVLEAIESTKLAQPGHQVELSLANLNQMAQVVPLLQRSKNDVCGKRLVDLIVEGELTSSKAEARRLIENKGVYLNQRVVEDAQAVIQDSDLIENQVFLLSVGKKKRLIVKVLPG